MRTGPLALWDSVAAWMLRAANTVSHGVVDRCYSQKEGGAFQQAEKTRMILLWRFGGW